MLIYCIISKNFPSIITTRKVIVYGKNIDDQKWHICEKKGGWEKNDCMWILKLIKPDKPLKSVCKIKDFDIVLKQMLLVTTNW